MKTAVLYNHLDNPFLFCTYSLGYLTSPAAVSSLRATKDIWSASWLGAFRTLQLHEILQLKTSERLPPHELVEYPSLGPKTLDPQRLKWLKTWGCSPSCFVWKSLKYHWLLWKGATAWEVQCSSTRSSQSSSEKKKMLDVWMIARSPRWGGTSRHELPNVSRYLELLGDLGSVQEQPGAETVHRAEASCRRRVGVNIKDIWYHRSLRSCVKSALTRKFFIFLEHLGVHGCWHHILGGDIFTVSGSEPLLQGFEVHRWQGGAGTALDAWEGLQHLRRGSSWDERKMEEEVQWQRRERGNKQYSMFLFRVI